MEVQTHAHEEGGNSREQVSSIQATPTSLLRQNPLNQIHMNQPTEEPPPPYEELAAVITDGLPSASIEYRVDIGPQLPPPESSLRDSRRETVRPQELTTAQSASSHAPAFDTALLSASLHVQSNSANAEALSLELSSAASTPRNISSAKAREAGFEIEPSSSRADGNISGLQVLQAQEPLHHSYEPGKVRAYIIPFPKPRLRGVRPEDIPERFLIYTPPLPPLPKLEKGEKENQWRKMQRQQQEDDRKETLKKTSRTGWKGLKSGTASMVKKGVNKTRSTTVEFLDRASEGFISSTTNQEGRPDTTSQVTDTPMVIEPASTMSSSQEPTLPLDLTQSESTSSSSKDPMAKPLEELILIYPPSLAIPSYQLRTRFVETLARAGQQSRKEAIIASTLVPFAAAVDASLILTLGALTQISGAWAYTNTRGAITSRKMTKGLARGEKEELRLQELEMTGPEIRGCICGHHESSLGAPTVVPPCTPGKDGKKLMIAFQLQQTPQMEILRRYLDLACLDKDFAMFPQIEEAAGDVNEVAVLEAIGWKPTKRQGKDLDVDLEGRVETLSVEQDEAIQTKQAREDVKRYMRKGATEWIAWCKSFASKPEAALKK